jgi:hypothetical protein
MIETFYGGYSFFGYTQKILKRKSPILKTSILPLSA